MPGRIKFSGLVIACVGGLTLILYASQSWAGSSGPGWATRQGTPAQQADATHDQDLATAKYCQAHPQIMHRLGACRQVMAKHPEMFSKPEGATPNEAPNDP